MAGVHPRGSEFAVTGGCGFIGGHLVDRLLREGAARVVVLDARAAEDTRQLAGRGDPRVDLVTVRLGDASRASLREALAGVQGVFHLAALKHHAAESQPLELLRQNVEGTAALSEAAGLEGVTKLVFASSLYAYGRDRGAPFDEQETPHPHTTYGISKLAGEHLVAHCSRVYGFDAITLRYLFVYGPRQYGGYGYKSVVVRSFERLWHGQPALVYGDGTQSLDYVYVDDAVEATLRAMQSDATGRTLNVGSGQGVRVIDLVERICALAGCPGALLHEPPDGTLGSYRVGKVDAIAEVLGWRASTSLEEGLRRTWEWLRAELSAPPKPS